MFMPPTSEGPPELSRTTAILLVFKVDSWHKRITDVYVRLVAHQFKSHLYALEQIPDFIKDIEADLKGGTGSSQSRG